MEVTPNGTPPCARGARRTDRDLACRYPLLAPSACIRSHHVPPSARSRRRHGPVHGSRRTGRRARAGARRSHHLLPCGGRSVRLAAQRRRGDHGDVAARVRLCLRGAGARAARQGRGRGARPRHHLQRDQRGQRHAIRGDRRGGACGRLRPDLHGLARPAQQPRDDARFADPQGRHVERDPRADRGDPQPGGAGALPRHHPRRAPLAGRRTARLDAPVREPHARRAARPMPR